MKDSEIIVRLQLAPEKTAYHRVTFPANTGKELSGPTAGTALAMSALAVVISIARNSFLVSNFIVAPQMINSRSSSSRIADTSGSAGGSPMVSSPRVISHATKASRAALLGNALASSFSLNEASLPSLTPGGGHRLSTVLSVPNSPGHDQAAEVATALGFRNNMTTQATSPITAMTTISAFFMVLLLQRPG